MELEISWKNYQWLAIVWLALGFFIFIALQFKTAPYGRHARTDWGPMISNRLGWIIMESTVLVVLWSWIGPAFSKMSLPARLMALLFTGHYLNRSFIFPLRTRTRNKKMPLVVALMAVVFNLANGSLFGIYFVHFEDYTLDWFRDLKFWVGLLIFLTGVYVNWRADNYLIRLRKPGESGYQIPRGWLFNFVSCPNFLGEMVEWLGFAILSWSLPGWFFFLWTCFNLIPRVVAHHRWYKTHFPEYPEKRKAFLPFVW